MKRLSKLIENLESRALLSADFTLLSMSDSQYYVESFPQIFNAQIAYAANPANNVNLLSIQGDMLRRGYSTAQCTTAQSALNSLNTKIPYTTVIGNHDYDNQFDDLDHNNISSANYTSYFGDAMYNANSVSGFIASSLDQRNHAQVVTLGDRDYMILGLEWGASASSIAWAQTLINANPNLPVILTTHDYLGGAGRTAAGNTLFSSLVSPNPQIFLVLSGHTGAVNHLTSTNSAGQSVFQIVSDFESETNGGNGFFQLLHFLPDQNQIAITTYSPYLNQSKTTSAYQYTLSLNFASRFNFSNTPVPIIVNDNAPVAIDDSIIAAEGKSITFSAAANDSDPDGNAVSALLRTLPAHGALYVNSNGTYTYTPDPHYAGDDSFTYYPSDGTLKGNFATVNVSVAATPASVVYNYPTGETTSAGTRVGTFANLTASDGNYETFTGSTVTQKWSFSVAKGTEATFCVNGFRAWNSHEFKLQYSTNGSTWNNMTPIVSNSSLAITRTAYDADEPCQMWRLPATTSGNLYIKPAVTSSKSNWSFSIDEMFVMTTGVAPVVAPNAPSSLTGTYSKTKKTETLRWTDNAANETGYRLYYSTDNGANWTTLNLAANTTSYTLSVLTGKTYKFKVSAYNSAGETFSSILTVNT